MGGNSPIACTTFRLELGATLVILMLAVLACLLDQRLSVETAKVEVLRQSEERFRSLVQNTHLILSRLWQPMAALHTSLSVKQILGYEPELARQKAFLSILTILPRQRTS